MSHILGHNLEIFTYHKGTLLWMNLCLGGREGLRHGVFSSRWNTNDLGSGWMSFVEEVAGMYGIL